MFGAYITFYEINISQNTVKSNLFQATFISIRILEKYSSSDTVDCSLQR